MTKFVAIEIKYLAYSNQSVQITYMKSSYIRYIRTDLTQ